MSDVPQGGGLPRWPAHAASLILAVVLITYIVIRIGYKDIPLERDEGAYVYMGRALLHGGVPYMDFFEMKPPGLFYTYALLYAVSGGSLAWMHVWMALFVAVGALFFHGLARSWLGSGPALAATVAYSALSMSLHAAGFTLQAEHFVVVFALAGLYVLDRSLERRLSWGIVLAGVLLCWSVSIKQNAVFFAAFAATYVLFAYPVPKGGRGPHARTRRLALLAAGALLPLTAFLLTMLVHGSLGQFWFWIMEVSRGYIGETGMEAGYHKCARMLGVLFREDPVPWVLGVAGASLLWIGTRPWWQRLAVGLFLLASALSVMPGLWFYGHYFLLFFPALALCSGTLVQVVTHWLAHRAKERMGATAGSIAAISLFIVIMVQQRHWYFTPDHTEVLRRVYGTNPFPEARMVADLINERIKEGDGLFVMGFEPQIYLYTGTSSPTRWLNPNALLVVHPLSDSIRKEVRMALAASSPRFVVWVQHFTSWNPPRNADQSFLEEYWDQLYSDYEVIAWYEQDPPHELHVVTGEAARGHTPQGDLFMFLAERREAPPGATAR